MKTKQEYYNEYIKKGFSFFNTGTNLKKTVTKWTEFQHRKPTNQELARFYNMPTENLAVVCGKISDLIVFDVDTKKEGDPTPFLNKGMYEVRTPSGGYHFYCKYDPLLESTKHKKKPQDGILKDVDIQSNGALAFLPPTTYPNGTYTVVNDVPIGPVPDDVLAMVLDALKPEKEVAQEDIKPYKPLPHHFEGNAKPGDIYNALATWAEVLMPLGWTTVGPLRNTGVQYWRRPGKKDGVSASTNWGDYDLLIPFTTSTDLIQFKGYTKFNALASLQYNGDYKKTARELILQNSKLATKHFTR
jgi:hypothetical protein